MATDVNATENHPDLQVAPPGVNNSTIARALAEMASLLQAQGDNPFRVAAYRRASETVAQLGVSLREIHRSGGVAALDALPGKTPNWWTQHMFSDGFHPTPYAHTLMAQSVTRSLQQAGSR